MDPATGRVWQGGKATKLEPRVMDVLVYLADRPGKVVSREEIEAELWAGRVVGYDALTGTMLKLRKAIDDDARHPRIIETVSKKGYRLVAPVAALEESAEAKTAPEGAASQAKGGKLPRRTSAVAAVVIVLVQPPRCSTSARGRRPSERRAEARCPEPSPSCRSTT